MSIFVRADWDRLATLFEGTPIIDDQCGHVEMGVVCGRPPHHLGAHGPRLRGDWPVEPYSGYKPATVEAPNGDTKDCPDCLGEGGAAEPGDVHHDSDLCPRCAGSGRVPNTDAAGTCGCCDGTGRHEPRPYDLSEDCSACSGTGRVQGKRYLHVADKYADAPAWARAYQDRAYAHACRVAEALQVPKAFWPMPSVGALRVLEYPPGAGSVEHTDSDLFTVVCWRETPADLELVDETGKVNAGAGAWVDSHAANAQAKAQEIAARFPYLHIGEIGELVGLGPATPHRVPARPYVQRSIVYFAIPDHAARLPCCGSNRALGERIENPRRRRA